MKEVMLTTDFRATSKTIPINKVTPNSGYYYDDRLERVLEANDLKQNALSYYLMYNLAYCEELNRDPKAKPAYLTSCGFLPVGIDPTMLAGMTNKYIIPALQKAGIEYFELAPLSPVKRTYEPKGAMATLHDVWVNKVDAQRLVNKPLWNITAFDLLEKLEV